MIRRERNKKSKTTGRKKCQQSPDQYRCSDVGLEWVARRTIAVLAAKCAGSKAVEHTCDVQLASAQIHRKYRATIAKLDALASRCAAQSTSAMYRDRSAQHIGNKKSVC